MHAINRTRVDNHPFSEFEMDEFDEEFELEATTEDYEQDDDPVQALMQATSEEELEFKLLTMAKNALKSRYKGGWRDSQVGSDLGSALGLGASMLAKKLGASDLLTPAIGAAVNTAARAGHRYFSSRELELDYETASQLAQAMHTGTRALINAKARGQAITPALARKVFSSATPHAGGQVRRAGRHLIISGV